MKYKPYISLNLARVRYGRDKTIFPEPVFVPEGCCKWCGKEVYQQGHDFCSLTCQGKFTDTIRKGRLWSSYINQLMRRDQFSCRDCGEFHAYQNDHGVYIPLADRDLLMYRVLDQSDHPDCLVTLCRDCFKDALECERKGYQKVFSYGIQW